MIKEVKKQAKRILEKRCNQQYQLLLEKSLDSYDSWIRRKEEQEDKLKPLGKIAFFSIEEWKRADAPWEKTNREIICFVEPGGKVRDTIAARLEQCFLENPQLKMVYGDEDEWNREKKMRSNPWYKSGFAPNTLCSWFYLGSLVAFRRDALHRVSFAGCQTARQKWYAFCLEICLKLKRQEVFHLQEIVVTTKNRLHWGFEEEYAEIRKRGNGLIPVEPTKGISIIIPSKDNPKVLNQCLASIRDYSDGMEYEIIVVDNGSSEEAQLTLREMEKEYGFRYLYRPMAFNFSRMCNIGVEESTKEMLLFLNDDCEARHEGWLRELFTYASQSHVGSVGTKLYYPDSKMMQHCGVYSIYLGPAHKLQYSIDDQIYYDRRNRDVRNVMAATGACLMMRKSVFVRLQGFDEKLEVAFNDVDLCWRLYEMGYYNVVHNEIYLWHHESLSRGSDTTPEKQKRLQREHKRLYEKHKHLWNNDPYYHPGFTTYILDYNYSFAYQYDTPDRPVLKPKRLRALPAKLREDDCVAPSFEFTGDAAEWFANTDKGDRKKADQVEGMLYLQGTSMVLGSDNACFEMRFLFLGKQGVYYQCTPERIYRPDVVANVEGQVNVELSGFACFVETKRMQDGNYELAVLVKDRCSGQYLLKRVGMKLSIYAGKGRRNLDHG